MKETEKNFFKEKTLWCLDVVSLCFSYFVSKPFPSSLKTP